MPAARKRPKQSKPKAMPAAVWADVIAGSRCGAKTKAGGWCKRQPYLAKLHQDGRPGPWRCRYHGGVQGGQGAPRANQNAVSHGIYSQALTPDEQILFASLEARSLDDEILMTKIRLRRAFRAEHLQDLALAADPDTEHGLHLIERRVSTAPSEEGGGMVTTRSALRKRSDFSHIIDRLVMQLTRLVAQKLALEGDASPDIEKTAAKIREAVGLARSGTRQDQTGFVHLPLHALGVRNAENN